MYSVCLVIHFKNAFVHHVQNCSFFYSCIRKLFFLMAAIAWCSQSISYSLEYSRRHSLILIYPFGKFKLSLTVSFILLQMYIKFLILPNLFIKILTKIIFILVFLRFMCIKVSLYTYWMQLSKIQCFIMSNLSWFMLWVCFSLSFYDFTGINSLVKCVKSSFIVVNILYLRWLYIYVSYPFCINRYLKLSILYKRLNVLVIFTGIFCDF